MTSFVAWARARLADRLIDEAEYVASTAARNRALSGTEWWLYALTLVFPIGGLIAGVYLVATSRVGAGFGLIAYSCVTSVIWSFVLLATAS